MIIMTTFGDMKKILLAAATAIIASVNIYAQDGGESDLSAQYPLAGADETTPSKAEYFTWMSHTNEGPSETQTYNRCRWS